MPALLLAFALIFNASANIILKIGSAKGIFYQSYNPLILIQKNILFLSGLTLFAINLVFYFLALKKMSLSLAYPFMTMSSFIIINLFAYFYLKEHINFFQFLGYLLIILGLITVFYFKS